MRLNEVTSGKSCQICNIYVEPKLKRRLYELGFVPNAVVEILNISPMARAYLLKVQGAILALRGEIAHKIEVKDIQNIIDYAYL